LLKVKFYDDKHLPRLVLLKIIKHLMN